MSDVTNGRIALVTGGGTGVGRAMTKALLAAGWRLVITGRRAAVLDAAVHELCGNDGRVIAVPADIGDPASVALLFDEIRDRALVYLDSAPVGVLARDTHERVIRLPSATGRLTLLVEDQGRVNYGPRIGEHKGLIGPALLGGDPIDDWEVLGVRLDTLPTPTSATSAAGIAGPAFAAGSFVVEEPVDLFLSTAGWGKGNAFVNGFNLGRYWSSGPASTLYVPAPLLRRGENELVVFETLAAAEPVARFVAAADLGHTDF